MSKTPKVLGQWQILRPIGKRFITKKPKLKSMSKQQTSVEWLEKEIEKSIFPAQKHYFKWAFEQAKQMEKEQIMDFALWLDTEICKEIVHDFNLLGEDTSVENLYNTYVELHGK